MNSVWLCGLLLFVFLELCSSAYVPSYASYLRNRRQQLCGVTKSGIENGGATLFQEKWAYGNACGFLEPNTLHADGYYVAVGGQDWDNGLGCGTCAQLTYKGRSVVVMAVDYCGGCPTGVFDMGGPAWYDLTNNMPPGRIHGVSSRWVECPDSLTGGKNLQVYVKPGSHPWDARFQPQFHEAPVTGMSIKASGGWTLMQKCENFMFCKPRGLILNGANSMYSVRVHSAQADVELKLNNIPEGQYVDTGRNNGPCKNSNLPNEPTSPAVVITTSSTTPAFEPTVTTVAAAPTMIDCGILADGLYPNPDDCAGFIKCAQGTAFKDSCGSLMFDTVVYNCNLPEQTDCGTRPASHSYYQAIAKVVEPVKDLVKRVYSSISSSEFVSSPVDTSISTISQYYDSAYKNVQEWTKWTFGNTEIAE